MKLSNSSVALATLLFTIGVAPASAGILYDNTGPSTGILDAWGISFGISTANSFLLSHGATITGADFAVWVHPDATLTSVDWVIASDPLGSTTYASGTATAINQTSLAYPMIDGYNVDNESFSIPGFALTTGTYWLLLQNAIVSNGDHIYWDQSDGPSQAWNSDWGYLPGGYTGACTTPCTDSETFQVLTPEPASFGLLAMGLLGIATLLRRRINQ
jgi:hypothetical protein